MDDCGLDADRKGVRTEIDKLAIEFNYLMMVGVEDILLENIIKTKPKAVFIGRAHADSFWNRREELKSKYRIVIEEYWRDEITREPDILMAVRLSTENVPMEHYLESMMKSRLRIINPSENFREDQEVFTNKRLYKSIKEGRVTNGKPDFIGHWNTFGYYTGMLHRGLFEIYIETIKDHPHTSSEISGRIEDCLGTAKFQGIISPKAVSFSKVYTEASPEACPVPIQYEGDLQNGENGEYKGTFRAVMVDAKIHGTFTMKETR